MSIKFGLFALVVGALALPISASASPDVGSSQEVAKRAAKRGAKDAAGDAAGDAAKKAAKKAMAPDALDLNSATEEQLKKIGFDEETTKKVVAARPFTNLEDPKIKEAIPADMLTKLEGKINVKPAAK
jgi:DNA uptake protein ComE-like DNA-binding protein